MNDLINYEFENLAVRVVLIGTDPWWVANDVAKVLGYAEAVKLTRMLDDDEKGLHIVETLGGQQEMNVISESGLFAAILKSRRPEAKRFRRWVTGDVLPTLRRTGRYVMHETPPLDPPAIDNAERTEWSVGLGLIREARQVWGREECRALWIKIGLPSPFGDPDTLTDGFAQAVAKAIAPLAFFRTEDVLRMMGLPQDSQTKARFYATIKLLGWMSKTERVDGRPTKIWVPTAPRAAAEA